jgi:ribonuclease HII
MGLLEYLYEDKIEAGIDEVGRGCLSGPVVSSAVVLPKELSDEFKEIVRDSKKLSETKRLKASEIIKREAIDYAIGYIDSDIIDKTNILKSTFESMYKSLDSLKVVPEHLLIDGNMFDGYKGIDHTCVVKGDNKYYSIAAASILAKVSRDEYMKELHHKHPMYGWKSNKGYGSKQHREAIIEHGITPHHRKSFLKNILQS